LVARMLTHPV